MCILLDWIIYMCQLKNFDCLSIVFFKLLCVFLPINICFWFWESLILSRLNNRAQLTNSPPLLSKTESLTRTKALVVDLSLYWRRPDMSPYICHSKLSVSHSLHSESITRQQSWAWSIDLRRLESCLKFFKLTFLRARLLAFVFVQRIKPPYKGWSRRIYCV